MTLNLATLYEAVAAAVPDRLAVTGAEGRRTYAELDRRSNAFAAHLVAAGFAAGDHVGVYMRNSVEYVEALLGCFKARVVPVNINYRYTEHELRYLFDDADLVGVVVEDAYAMHVAALAGQCGKLRHVLVVHGDVTAEELRWSDAVTVADYEEALADQADDVPPVLERSADDRFVLYTGGTTGMPKGVVWRHEDFYFAALSGGNFRGDPYLTPDALAAAAAAGDALNYLICMPLMHGAATYTLFSGLLSGAHMVLLRTYDPVEMLRLIQEEAIQIAALVGDAQVRPFVDALREHRDDYDASSLFMVGSGGAILSRTVEGELRALLPHLMIGNSFGTSESGADAQIAVGPDGLMRLTSSASLRVVDEQHREVRAGSGDVGHLARSGHVPLGYYNDPDKTAATFPVIDGQRWVVLGDLARVEEDGTIIVLGRSSQCINTGGEKVFVEEVEQALEAHPDVMDVLVAGVPDERFGQRVGAVVELREGAAAEAEELRVHCRATLAGYKVPATIRFVDRVMRSPVGKADYRWAKSSLTVEPG